MLSLSTSFSWMIESSSSQSPKKLDFTSTV
uniref:Uncharacterized protein n=1 Tax=Arundo donax TaxID=35708 RepID=A0A0A9A660_ARUDO